MVVVHPSWSGSSNNSYCSCFWRVFMCFSHQGEIACRRVYIGTVGTILGLNSMLKSWNPLKDLPRNLLWLRNCLLTTFMPFTTFTSLTTSLFLSSDHYIHQSELQLALPCKILNCSLQILLPDQEGCTTTIVGVYDYLRRVYDYRLPKVYYLRLDQCSRGATGVTAQHWPNIIRLALLITRPLDVVYESLTIILKSHQWLYG